MKNLYKPFLILSLILVYLVIFAGALVRMTGSGMGCPDWPKCFGYLIPPTERSQLDWKPNHEYKNGQVIIIRESLRVAREDFKSKTAYLESNWEPYTKHDYAIFNPTHTWIEFINRLLGALAGLATLLLLLSALSRIKSDITATIGSFLVVLGMGFQGWLGKTVVDSNLLPYKITIHMGMALLIVLLLVYLLSREQNGKPELTQAKQIQGLAIVALVLSLIQIGMGTQVRQFVDEQMHAFNLTQPSQWLAEAPLLFYFHRSFSIAVLLLHFYWGYLLFKNNYIPLVFKCVVALIGLEILTGIWMYYFDFPFSSQPLHLILAALLFGAQSFLLFVVKRKS
ncbi:MAG: COX15/CtaA family protein [Flavobacteriaceae bacterium]|nr:COX15/CtaA family protein [Flavobacteriaceae bacterium]